MKIEFVSLGMILVLLCGDAVFAKNQQKESLVNKGRKQVESYGSKTSSANSQMSSLAQQLEQIRNDQKWIKDILIELRQKIQEAKTNRVSTKEDDEDSDSYVISDDKIILKKLDDNLL